MPDQGRDFEELQRVCYHSEFVSHRQDICQPDPVGNSAFNISLMILVSYDLDFSICKDGNDTPSPHHATVWVGFHGLKPGMHLG